MISLEEAESLINKLVTEKVPVCVCLTAKDGPAARFNGLFIERLPQGLMVWGEDEHKYSRRISSILLPVDKNCEFGFQDKRETPANIGPQKVADYYGDLMLWIRFASGSLVMIFFNE